jgi:hypothetical protein
LRIFVAGNSKRNPGKKAFVLPRGMNISIPSSLSNLTVHFSAATSLLLPASLQPRRRLPGAILDHPYVGK